MLPDFKSLKTMGVINVTPNSFSDPSKFFLTDALVDQLHKYRDRKDLIFDFGFESTAPMNAAISAEVERQRFDLFFEQIKHIDLSNRWISFDTYRPINFHYFKTCFQSHYQGQGFLFNDVSGVIDEELLNLLNDHKDDRTFYYLYSHTHIPERIVTLEHMKFARNGSLFDEVIKQFEKAQSLFHSLGMGSRFVFDPCFGFSKTYEQNWELIDRLGDLFNHFGPEVTWVIGLSKKSFLRKSLPPDVADPFAEAEKLHEELIKKIKVGSSRHLIFRVHDFDIVSRVEESLHA